MGITLLADFKRHHLQSPDGSASDHDLTLIEQQAHLYGSTQKYHERSALGDLPDSVLCATLLGSGAFADDKSYYCGLSTIDVGTAVEDMAEFRSAPVDLSCPKFAPSEELEADSHDQQMDFEDPPERASNILPLFNTSPIHPHGSLAFDITPPSLRRVQEKLAMRNFSGPSSNTPDVFNFDALGITSWSSSQEIPKSISPWENPRALEFHSIFYSPESIAKLSIMRASRTYPHGSTYTPSIASSDSTRTPPIDSMIKQKLAAQERHLAAPRALGTNPPLPWSTKESPPSSRSSLSRQLFEKLLRESSSPRAVDGLSLSSGPSVILRHGSPSGFFSPEIGKDTSTPSPVSTEMAFNSVAKDRTETWSSEGAITARAAFEIEHQNIISSSVSADSTLLQLLRRGTAKYDLTVKPSPKEMREISVQTDSAPASFIRAAQADQTVSAIRIVALRSMQNVISELVLADQPDLGNLSVDGICPGSCSAETRCDGEVKKITQGSTIGRLVRFVLGW